MSEIITHSYDSDTTHEPLWDTMGPNLARRGADSGPVWRPLRHLASCFGLAGLPVLPCLALAWARLAQLALPWSSNIDWPPSAACSGGCAITAVIVAGRSPRCPKIARVPWPRVAITVVWGCTVFPLRGKAAG